MGERERARDSEREREGEKERDLLLTLPLDNSIETEIPTEDIKGTTNGQINTTCCMYVLYTPISAL